jgi:hypothetical protein
VVIDPDNRMIVAFHDSVLQSLGEQTSL